jgi:probable HAF family extracellular repeat protein
MRDLGLLPGGPNSFGSAVSGNGLVVTGYGAQATGFAHAIRWTDAGGMQDLGALPNGGATYGTAVNADGSAIVGYDDFNNGTEDAFLWTPTLGMVDLNTYLPSLGIDLAGWTLNKANGISADGAAITGVGTLNGQTRAWLVTGVPSPGPASLLGTCGLLGIRRARRFAFCNAAS